MKDFFKKVLTLLTTISSSILFCSALFLLFTKGTSASFTCIDILALFSIAFLSAIISTPVYLNIPLKRGIILFLYIFHFLAVNCYTLFLGYKLNWFSFSNKKSIILIETLIIIVFIVVLTIKFIYTNNEAKKINQKLADLDL